MNVSQALRWYRRVGTAAAGFEYVDHRGTPVRDESALARFAALAIPPAWTDVHIAPDEGRKVQAWGRDAAGRKQYIYAASYIARRERRKWGRVLRFGLVLPRLREVTNRHLKTPPYRRERVLATVVRLMCRAFFRVGSERYAVRNRTFGICTLAKSHLEMDGSTLRFRYTGKRRKDQRQVVADTPLVEVVAELLELPGPRLFQYVDAAGRIRPVTAEATNQYLCEVLGSRYTSKDIRTFGGTVRAATILSDLGPASTERETKRNLAIATRLVALELGNTPSIARKAYIHPAVLEEYRRAGRTIATHPRGLSRPVEAIAPSTLYPEEAALIRFLERYG